MLSGVSELTSGLLESRAAYVVRKAYARDRYAAKLARVDEQNDRLSSSRG